MKHSFAIITLFVYAMSVGAQQLQDSLLERGIDNYMKGQYASAIELFLHTAEISQEAGDSTSLQSVYSNFGNAYALTGKIESALDYYQKATHLALLAKDTVRLAKITKNIGSLYSDQRDFDKALSYFDRGRTIGHCDK